VATPEGQLDDPAAAPPLRRGTARPPRPSRGSTLATMLSRVAGRPQAVLAACILTAMGFSLWVTRGQTLFSDEWGRWLRGDSLDEVLRGYSGHLVVLHTLLYQAVFGLFGANTYLPFRIIEAGLVGGCGLLFYSLARASSGPWASLAATVVLLFLGSAFEVTATPYGIVILLPMAFGLAALLCLRRFGEDGDPLTCLLLIAAVASQSVGLAFVVGSAVMLALQDHRRLLARAWVVAVPTLLYAAWYAWSRLTAPVYFEQPVHLSSLGEVPSTVVAVCAAGLSAVSGLFGESGFADGGAASFNLDAGYVVLGLLVIAVVWRVRSGFRPRGEIWVPVALALTFWVLVGMVSGAGRPPEASRYLYPSAAFLLLFLLELVRGVRATPRVALLVCAAVALSLVPNVVNLADQARRIRAFAGTERSELGAFELVRREVPTAPFPPLDLNAGVLEVGSGFIASSRYFSAVDRYGSPAMSPRQLSAATESQRLAADRVLLEVGDLAALRVPPARTPTAVACRLASAGSGKRDVPLRVPPHGLLVEPQGALSDVSVAAQRFAAQPQPVRLPRGPGDVLLVSGAPENGRPWFVVVDGATVCRPG
jgi:type II secretory pathway pseudopilin PulG